MVRDGTGKEHFEAMEEDPGIDEREDLWLDRGQENLLDASIFYDDFPPLPDFPCMSSSSSSSSSSTPKPLAATSSSSTATSSSPATYEGMNFIQQHQQVEPTASDCIDVMENLGYMDLIDTNEIWDPSSVFMDEHQAAPPPEEEDCGGFSFLEGNSELAAIFLEWLKQNRDYISAEDMRSIKLKRSTIESASKRLGSTAEGKKQLLKLILEWVEQYQLQKKRLSETAPHFPETAPNPNFVYNPNTDPTNTTAFPWMPSPPDVVAPPPPPPFPAPPTQQVVVNGIPYPHSAAAGMENAQPWAIPSYPVTQFSHNTGVYPYQVFDPNGGDKAARLGSSATKEARKKRMERQQRRLYSHHHHHRHATNSNQHQNDHELMMNELLGGDNADLAAADNWMCWSPNGGAGAGASPSELNSGDRLSTQQPNHQRNANANANANANTSSDRKPNQGWKTEKNLKFLLQKVLKQSDVGNLGRIVLPKKEAESHLPELETRDGISISMEDIGTSRVWNMRYRFWPNNKSRMYLLENTGDFVRANGLQEGDFIVIYSDTKCGKYMIRGVKVRQSGLKLESKKPARRNIRNLSLAAGNSSSLAPIKQAAVR